MHDRMASRRASLQVERWSQLTDLVVHARSRLESISLELDTTTPRLLLDRLADIERHLAANPYSQESLLEAMRMMRDISAPLSSLVTAIAAQRGGDMSPGPLGPP